MSSVFIQKFIFLHQSIDKPLMYQVYSTFFQASSVFKFDAFVFRSILSGVCTIDASDHWYPTQISDVNESSTLHTAICLNAIKQAWLSIPFSQSLCSKLNIYELELYLGGFLAPMNCAVASLSFCHSLHLQFIVQELSAHRISESTVWKCFESWSVSFSNQF